MVWRGRDEARTIIDKIASIFESIRRITDNDQFHNGGVQKFKDQVSRYIESNQALEFILPAFPAKSPNQRKKVLGTLPDGAEEVSLQYLHNFNENVKTVYPAGSKVIILVDSFIYTDLLGIPDDHVMQYRRALECMYQQVAGKTKKTLAFVGFQEVLGLSGFQESREKIMLKYGKTLNETLSSINENEGERKAYQGITHFLHDDLDVSGILTRSQREKQAKRIAKQMMQRKSALDELIKTSYGKAIRLSIHPHPGNLGKIGINLIHGIKNSGTPWHNVLVKYEDGTHEFMRREKAESLKYELIYQFGRPYYYRG